MRLPFTFLIVFALLAMTSAGVVVASRQDEPSSWAIFRAPDGTPCESVCVLGIVPGKTSLAEAETLLNEHPYTHGVMLNEQTANFRQYITPDDGLIVTLQMDDPQTITWIRAGFANNVLTYGEALALLGKPQLVRFAAREGGGFLSLYYDGDLVISSYQRTNYFYPTQRVSGIELSAEPIARRIDKRFDFVQFTVNEFPFWQGFGAILRYIVHPECRRPGAEGIRVCHL